MRKAKKNSILDINQGLNVTLVYITLKKSKENDVDKVGFPIFYFLSFYFPPFIIHSDQISFGFICFFIKILHNCSFIYNFFLHF
jgi:hypothetical protein